jgi:hypothetical protein
MLLDPVRTVFDLRQSGKIVVPRKVTITSPAGNAIDLEKS